MFLSRVALRKALLRMVLLALLPISAAAWAQTAAPAAPAEPILPFTQFTLDNGLTVLVREDRKLPIVSVEVIYRAGSRDDPPGKAGLAHLFEHLLFYGSQHNPRSFLTTMQSLGGTNVNGGTGHDTTNLIVTVPTSQARETHTLCPICAPSRLAQRRHAL